LAVGKLDQAIEEEMITGYGLIPRAQWHYFNDTVEALLNKSLDFKSAWLRNIEIARKYGEGVYLGLNAVDIIYYEEREALRIWLDTGRGI
jgi:hypothetical protein